MTFSFRAFAGAGLLLASSIACSNGTGFLGHDYPAGDIAITDPATGAPITTSLTAPFIVGANTLLFSIAISETRFSGPFTVSVIKQDSVPTALNGGFTYPYTFNVPCFVARQPADSSSHANVVTFKGDNANAQPYNYPNGSVPTAPTPTVTGSPAAAATPLPGGNPCHSGELETAEISDGKGHSLLFYYEEQ